jgi:metal-responsive CopG/Arc/MetJ family transcriptional regulator
VPEELWIKFGEATGQVGTDRSAVLRDFIRWYVRERDGKPPARP